MRILTLTVVIMMIWMIPVAQAQNTVALNQDAPVIDISNIQQVRLMAELELGNAGDVQWSPDGRRIAIAAHTAVHIYQTFDMTADPLVIDFGAAIFDIAFDPGGLQLAVSTRQGFEADGSQTADTTPLPTLHLISVIDGSILTQELVSAYDLDFNTDGSKIAFVGLTDDQEQTVNLWNPLTDEITVLSEPQRRWLGVAFNQDGTVVSSVTGDRILHLWDVASGQLIDTIDYRERLDDQTGSPYVVWDSIVMNTGQRTAIASGNIPDVVYVDGVNNTSSSLSLTIPEDIIPFVAGIDWHPTSPIIAASLINHYLEGDNSIFDGVYIWFSGTDGLPSIWLPHIGSEGVAFSPDGQSLISTGNHRVRLWRVGTVRVTEQSLNALATQHTLAYCSTFEAGKVEQIAAGESHDIFWSWYAVEREDLEEHIYQVRYYIQLNGQALKRWIFLSSPAQDPVNNGDWTVYYHMPLKSTQPGDQLIEYQATWYKPIWDGYAEFGPETSNESDTGECAFQAR